MEREVYFEFTQVGNAVKVTAIDSQTKIEVSIVAPAKANIEVMKQQALRKLQYVLNK